MRQLLEGLTGASDLLGIVAVLSYVFENETRSILRGMLAYGPVPRVVVPWDADREVLQW